MVLVLVLVLGDCKCEVRGARWCVVSKTITTPPQLHHMTAIFHFYID